MHPPVLETKVVFAGVESATDTPVAEFGPLLVTADERGVVEAGGLGVAPYH